MEGAAVSVTVAFVLVGFLGLLSVQYLLGF
jgi:hypothetical protein